VRVRPFDGHLRYVDVFGGHVDAQDPAGHGIRVDIADDWVELVDTWAEGQPRVRFTRPEYEAFIESVRRGQFDLLPRPRQGDDG
jgi:hypothetical protein